MNSKCNEIAELNISGNIIPILWFENIRYKTEKGTEKANTLAILILSDIVYWYRPYEIRDEQTGSLVELKQKFKADKLQKSYSQYANIFGSTKNSIKSAIDFLVDFSLINREFRDINIKGKRLTNVMFLEPIPGKIKQISTSLKKNGEVKKIEYPPSKKSDTYTKTTHSEITPELKELKIRKEQKQKTRPFFMYVNKIRKWADKYRKMNKPFVLKFENKLYDFEFKEDGNHYLRNFETKKILTQEDAEYVYKILNHRQEIPIYENINIKNIS